MKIFEEYKSIEEECADEIRIAIRNAIYEGDEVVNAKVVTFNGMVSVSTNCDDEVEVEVIHDNGHECPNLCEKIAKAIPKWDYVSNQLYEEMGWKRQGEEEEEEEGYNDLDSAFSSWEDFYNYKGV